MLVLLLYSKIIVVIRPKDNIIGNVRIDVTNIKNLGNTDILLDNRLIKYIPVKNIVDPSGGVKNNESQIRLKLIVLFSANVIF